MTRTAMDLSDLPAQIWAALETGARVAEDPFRTAVLATSADGACAVRTVVLQYASVVDRLLACCSDVRSGKVRQIQSNPNLAWVFYDPRTRTQVRAEGCGTVRARNDAARRAWQLLPAAQRAVYCSPVAPGTVIPAPQSALARTENGSLLTELELEAGFSNFAVIECVVDEFDWLRLEPGGYQRAALRWSGKEFAGHWLAP